MAVTSAVTEVTSYACGHDIWHQSLIRESHVGKVIINNLFLKKTTLHSQTTYTKNHSLVSIYLSFSFSHRLGGENEMKRNKKNNFKYSSLLLFESFNGGNRKFIILFESLSGRE